MSKVATMFVLINAISSQDPLPAGEGCCQKRTVSDVASELNGIYTWTRDGGEAENEDCLGGCVYTK